MGLEPMAIRLKAECSIQLSYSPVLSFSFSPFFLLLTFHITMRFYILLVVFLFLLFLALVVQIVGTIESRIVDFPFLHIDFESVFVIDSVLLLSIFFFHSLVFVPLSIFVHQPGSLSFFFVLVFPDPLVFVVFYLFESFFSLVYLLLLLFLCGNDESRTRDPLHATQVHYQLCYIPFFPLCFDDWCTFLFLFLSCSMSSSSTSSSSSRSTLNSSSGILLLSSFSRSIFFFSWS